MIECKLDKTIHSSLEELHKYIRKFHIKQADYYCEYYPRNDLLTGEKIDFKDYNQYFNQDFKNKNNLKKWLKTNPEEGMMWIKNWYEKRINEKQLKFALSQIELQLLDFVDIEWMDKHLEGGYNKLCQELNLPRKFYEKIHNIDYNQSIEIIQDTREKKELKFPNHIKIIKDKLSYGDMSLSYDQHIVVERKSLIDVCGSLSKGYERFCKEFERAKECSGYIIVCIEGPISDFKSISYLPHTKHVKATYQFLGHRIREIYKNFENVQFCFCLGRKHISKVIEYILKTGYEIKTTDIQLLIDKELL